MIADHFRPKYYFRYSQNYRSKHFGKIYYKLRASCNIAIKNKGRKINFKTKIIFSF